MRNPRTVSVFTELSSDQAPNLVEAIKQYKLKPSISKAQIENFKFNDKARIMAVLATVLHEKSPNEELEQAQSFFDSVPFIRPRLLPKERRELELERRINI